MQFLKQSTACTIMFGPFVDKTDGVTLETGAGIITSIDHATTGIFLSKAGGAAAIRSQAVTASVLDAYGMFKVTLSTTDTATVGTLDVLMAEAATFLPVHKSFMVLPANVYDSLMGTDLLDVNAAQWLGTAILTPGTAGTPDVNAKLIGGTAQTGNDAGADLNAIVAKLPTNYIMGSSVVTDKDDDIDAILTDTGTTLDGKINTIDDFLDTEIAAILAAVDTEIGAIKSVTDVLPDAGALTSLAQDSTVAKEATLTAIKGATWSSTTDTLELIRDKETDIETDTQDLQTQVGTDGAGLTNVPWNASWDAEVESEVDDSIGGGTGTALTAIPYNAAWDADIQSECTDALNAYDPPTKAEVDTAVANVSVDEIQASALADLFNTDSLTTYAASVAGSPIKEIADNAIGGAVALVDAVWNEAKSGHTTADTFGYYLDHRVSKSGGAISLMGGGGESVWSKVEKDKILKQVEEGLRLLAQKLDAQTFNIAITALAELLEKVEDSIKSGEVSVKADLEKKITELVAESTQKLEPLLQGVSKEIINLQEIENKGIQATQELDQKWGEEIKETLISVLTPLLPDETLERMVKDEQGIIE